MLDVAQTKESLIVLVFPRCLTLDPLGGKEGDARRLFEPKTSGFVV